MSGQRRSGARWRNGALSRRTLCLPCALPSVLDDGAAVDVPSLAGHPRTFVRAQEQHRIGYVRGGSDPAQRDLGGHAPPLITLDVAEARGVGEARTDRVDTDLCVADLLRH